MVLSGRHMLPQSTKCLSSASQRYGLVVLGIIALAIQLASSVPGFASSGTWIEICSEAGVKLVQVDLRDAGSDTKSPLDCCENCVDCALCATTANDVDNSHDGYAPLGSATTSALIVEAQLIGSAFSRAWPETRGPPPLHMVKNDHMRRAFSASDTNEGDAS